MRYKDKNNISEQNICWHIKLYMLKTVNICVPDIVREPSSFQL